MAINQVGDGSSKNTNQKPHVIKWIIIGALGTMTFILMLICVLFYIFTPLIKIDETTGRIKLFGGTVDVQARDVITQLSKDGSFVFGNMDGVEKLAPEIKKVEIKFSAGEVRVDYNESEEINWDCDGAGKNSKVLSDPKEGKVLLDFSAAFVDCDISLPTSRELKLTGSKGQIEVRKMASPIDITLGAGDVYLQPVEGRAYIYQLKSLEGEASSSFVSSPDGKGVPVSVEIKLGDILPLD
jgi:hypothetical protein